MDERDIDVIEQRLPKNASALVVSDEGEVTVLIPKMADDALVSDGLMAITELMLRLTEESLTVAELAKAFRDRERS